MPRDWVDAVDMGIVRYLGSSAFKRRGAAKCGTTGGEFAMQSASLRSWT